MEKIINVKHYWADVNKKGTISLFILDDKDQLTEYEDIKVTNINYPSSEDLSKYSDDGGITFKMNFSKPIKNHKNL